jgi:hypothetical protein
VTRGNVVGKTDAIGGSPVERPLSAKDVLATVYHLLGVDPHTTLTGFRQRWIRPSGLQRELR